jgi:MerR family transcriptional regulator, light-induced transcriptional regulator
MKTLLSDKDTDKFLTHQSDHIIRLIMSELLPNLPMSYDWRTHLELYFQHFIQAYKSNRPLIFTRFHDWSKIVEESRFQSDRVTQEIGKSLIRNIQIEYDNSVYLNLEQFFYRCLSENDPDPVHIHESWLKEDSDFYPIISEYVYSLLHGDKNRAYSTIMTAVEDDIPVKDLYLHFFQPGLYEIGRLWQLNQISVAQEHYFTAATELIMSQLYPRIFNEKRNGKRMVSTAVGGNLHEVGIRMVSDLFEMDGWDTYFIGSGCPVEELIREITHQNADLLVLSVTMATLLDESQELIQIVKQDSRCRNIPVLVGGRAFDDNDEIWKEVGADGYTAHIDDAPAMATEMIER